MGRKNKRKRTEYRHRLGFDARKYVNGAGNRLASCPYSMRFPLRTPQRGDIWFAELGRHPGTCVQSGCRPVVIISNDRGNNCAETLNVLPMTRHLKKPSLPCHTELYPERVTDASQALDPSMILAEQVTTVSKTQLRNYVGRITDDTLLRRIEHALSIQLGMAGINHNEINRGDNHTNSGHISIVKESVEQI